MKEGDAVGLANLSGVVTNMETVVGYKTLVHVVWYVTSGAVHTRCGYWIEIEDVRETSDVPTCVECACSTRRTH